MDEIQEIPAKKRKIDNGTTRSQGYDSQNDSGDEIFYDYETVATIPLPARNSQQQVSLDILSSPPTHITQPTQLLNVDKSKAENGGEDLSQIQVPASSPIRAAPGNSPVPTNRGSGGKLATTIAPAGTTFRLPVGVTPAPTSGTKFTPLFEISDDDLPTYNGSSDEDSQARRRADIKPSTFTNPAQKIIDSADARKRQNRFREVTANYFYNPSDKTSKPKSNLSKRSVDTMANAYGNVSRTQLRPLQQSGPAKAIASIDIDVNDIQDYQMRNKIQHMRRILPHCRVSSCKKALELKKFNYDDAIELLLAQEDNTAQIDLTGSDGDNGDDGDDPLNARPIVPKKASAKQQIKVKQNIQEKWTATQSLPKEVGPLSSPEADSLPAPAPPPKLRRRLVKGLKQSSTRAVSLPQKQPSPALAPSPTRSLSLDPDASDSGLGSEPDTELETKVLRFFNTCSTLDLADIAMITAEVADTILSQRAFSSLEDIRRLAGNCSSKNGKTASTKKPVGDKIVDKCLDMWAGYEAVDMLVKKCEDISKPLKLDMESWGVDVFGASLHGELDLTNFSRDVSPRDSGIGTPTSLSVSDTEDGDITQGGKRHGLFPQPFNMAKDVKLKDYQIVGINWLSMLFEKRLSCILADDMGLGKTCQVIAFFAHLLEKGVKGPHLVIVPGSTLENWLREFSVFCPQLHVMPYYASQNERPGIQLQILDSRDKLNVVVTTYTLAKQKDDNKFLRKLNPVVCVYDEGHLLKNSKSAGYEAYMKIPSEFRLLLTGTPLQNNLKELTSLLGFILPSLFKQHREDLEAIFSHKAKTTNESHAALLSDQRIARAKSMMTPFVLRRKKHQVLKHLPAKHRRVEYCELSESQSELYRRETAKAQRIVAARAAGEKTGNETSNVMMALRKASIHPLLFRRLYNETRLAKMSKAIVKEEQFQQSNISLVYEDMEVMTDMELHRLCEANPKTMTPYLLQNEEWMDSGKISKLTVLLRKYKEDGDRVLVFSQFTMVMDILESVMETLGMRFFRLDGRTNINERQTMIDQFYEDHDITVFLLSTKAGGAGINLACSNKVIIFDSSFNPQDDIQAGKRYFPPLSILFRLTVICYRESSTQSGSGDGGRGSQICNEGHNRRADSCIGRNQISFG